jgi:hypothetical protein
MSTPLEHNTTGIDYGQRGHLAYAGPIIDFHAHVMITRPDDPPNGPPKGHGPGGTIDQAESMLGVGAEFGIGHTVTMCPPDDIPLLRERFGDRLSYNGMINKPALDAPDDVAYKALDRFLELGAKMLKFWSAPRGRERGLLVDAPWRIEVAKRAQAAGMRIIMVHVGDPDVWFRTVYADSAKFGTKPEQYERLERMLQMFPEIKWVGAHMGGDVEHPDHLEALLEKYPHFYLDTSATKWQIREASPRAQAVRDLICRYSSRFFFGTDLVTRHHLTREHYVSRYWCQRTLWESNWQGTSPIADSDYHPAEGQPPQPQLSGVGLPIDVVRKVYHENAAALIWGE